jgi:hypothetical protein
LCRRLLIVGEAGVVFGSLAIHMVESMGLGTL